MNSIHAGNLIYLLFGFLFNITRTIFEMLTIKLDSAAYRLSKLLYFIGILAFGVYIVLVRFSTDNNPINYVIAYQDNALILALLNIVLLIIMWNIYYEHTMLNLTFTKREEKV